MTMPMDKQRLITELQSHGLRLTEATMTGRQGGAGPSDHRAVTIGGTTVMVPIYTNTAGRSPYHAILDSQQGEAKLQKHHQDIAPITLQGRPKFYDLETAEGIPYWKIALLHSNNVLATTVQQTCMRYRDESTACQFCAIEKSLESERTIARKRPEQLAEVVEAAVRLDGIEQVIMTTGTPNTGDRGAAYLTKCAAAIKAKVDIPIQAQCEPPADFVWFERLKAAGVDSLGMHLEAVDPAVRAKIMPGKAEVPVSYYYQAYEAAVQVFGWAQVSTYLLAGLGDSFATLVTAVEKLVSLGVYPFVVPFVPISGTPLATHPAPDPEFMFALYQKVGQILKEAGMSSQAIKAGCAKCGACSALSTFEN
ncbi:MSMEG_0568 family radical SAM protein [Picosynechococcus sp. NKBG042902]|uniref:MSMEG_0568 family radical SAM protein n=2 Tax=Picosynechococcus sp. NKBG042902 TaxID=490193 RepID=UPI0028F41E29|nr:MSMEG_0568 family radical SAM protein [Picosynechococcus sp. NKBG042902]